MEDFTTDTDLIEDEHECDRYGECGCAEDAADADRDYWE